MTHPPMVKVVYIKIESKSTVLIPFRCGKINQKKLKINEKSVISGLKICLHWLNIWVQGNKDTLQKGKAHGICQTTKKANVSGFSRLETKA